jgi:hypothetical protein
LRRDPLSVLQMTVKCWDPLFNFVKDSEADGTLYEN